MTFSALTQEFAAQVPSIEGSDKFFIDMQASDSDCITINNIMCYDRGKGIAGKCMNLLIRLADKYQVDLELEAGPNYDCEGEGEVLDGTALVKWYYHLGFEWEDAPVMRRKFFQNNT